MAHDHTHLPAEAGVRTAFLVAAVLNGAFIAFEVVFGYRSGSLALISNAGHNIHVLGSGGGRSFAGSEEGELRRQFDRVGTVMSEGQETKAVFGFKPAPGAHDVGPSSEHLRVSHGRGRNKGGLP